MASLQQILNPNVLTSVISQIVGTSDVILNFMGFQPGGFNVVDEGHGREGKYHIFDSSRTIAKGRAPGTAAGRSRRQIVKAVPFVYPRMHDSLSIPAEYFHNIAQISNPTQRDEAGRDMIMRQTKFLSQKAANWRVAATVGMLKDSLYYHENGDDWYWTYSSSGNVSQINFGIPAGNKSQLNMTDRAGTSIFSGDIIDVSWDNTSADIPGHIAKINQARAQQGVGPVRHIHCRSTAWQHVMNNDKVAAHQGIASPPYQTFTREVGVRQNGEALNETVATVASLPGITWHISDEGLELGPPGSETWQTHWEDGYYLFMGDPMTSDRYAMMVGSEPIAEYDGGPKTVRRGLSSWAVDRSNPTATEVYVLDNALPVPHDPYDLDYGQCVF